MSTLSRDDRIYDIGADVLESNSVLDVTAGRLCAEETPWYGSVSKVDGIRTVKINICS